MKRTFKVAAVLCALLVIGAYLAIRQFGPRAPSMPDIRTSTSVAKTTVVPDLPALTAARTAPTGAKEFRNEFYRFQIFYPDTFKVSLTKEQGSAATISFVGADTSNQFEIYVIPFGGTEITQTIMSRDEPSGVFKDLEHLRLGDLDMMRFDGRVEPIGDTREYWFISQGFLYEVVAPIRFASNLDTIMTSFEPLRRQGE